MRKKILLAIGESWFEEVFEYMSGEEFFKKILIVHSILKAFKCNNESTIALYGRNSMNWIVIYLACLLKGVRLLIIHPDQDDIEATHITLITNTSHIFIDDNLIKKGLVRNLFLKTIISIDTLSVLFERNDKSYFKVLAETITNIELCVDG